MICLPCLFAPLVVFLCIFTRLLTCSCVSLCLLVCHPYFNTMKIWTPDPNLHLSPVDTIFCLLFACLSSFLFTCLHATLFLCLPCLSCLSDLCLFCMLFTFFFPPIACLLVSCLYLCMYAHGARTLGARAQFPRREQKRHGCKHVDVSLSAVFSRLRSLVYLIWLYTLLNPLPSSFPSFLDGLY